MKKLLGILALSAAIPALQAGVYNFSTLHQDSTGNTSTTRDSALGDHKSDSRPGTVTSLVGGDDTKPSGVPTPEPGFYGLMAAGFGALVIFHGRKRRQA
jgi:hypothetical protein